VQKYAVEQEPLLPLVTSYRLLVWL